MRRDGATRAARERLERDAAVNEQARRERLRADGARSLGDNLQHADALVKAAFELSRAFAGRGG